MTQKSATQDVGGSDAIGYQPDKHEMIDAATDKSFRAFVRRLLRDFRRFEHPGAMETTEDERCALRDLCAESPSHSITTTKLLRDFERQSAELTRLRAEREELRQALKITEDALCDAAQVVDAEVDYWTDWHQKTRDKIIEARRRAAALIKGGGE